MPTATCAIGKTITIHGALPPAAVEYQNSRNASHAIVKGIRKNSTGVSQRQLSSTPRSVFAMRRRGGSGTSGRGAKEGAA